MMCIGMFMAILDVQVVATSLPNIQGALLPPLEPLGLAASRCIDWRWDCRRLGNSWCCHGLSPPVPLLGSGV